MTRSRRREPAIKRFCDLMGGQGMLARAVARVADWIVLQPARPAYSNAAHRPAAASDDLHPGVVMMAEGPGTGGTNRPAPTTPHKAPTGGGIWRESDRPGGGFWGLLISPIGHVVSKAVYDRTHTKTPCQEPQYRGMHGRPCKYEGGSDLKCPKDTVSGWYWYYDTPAGRIYYVDCCGGGKPKNLIFCNWTNEQNWCLQVGKAAAMGISKYFCTLAIPDANMKTSMVTTKNSTYLEVTGVES